MFREAVQKSYCYTRPIITGHLIYKDRKIINGISTILVLNKNGDILTCKHIADLFLIAKETNEVFGPILEEIKNAKEKDVKKIEKKYGIKDDTLIGMANILIDVSSSNGDISLIKHPTLDLAIIKTNSKDLLVNSFPVFNKDVSIGTSVLKVGFAFPEYEAFEYSSEESAIINNNKRMVFPMFPSEGMITRNMINDNDEITSFEISTPIVPGQAGGCVVNSDGEVLGIMTGNEKIVSADVNNPYSADLGVAISSKYIIEFLKDNKIEFEETEK